jgi:diguanylate cyclase (GGDEF)-like protein
VRSFPADSPLHAFSESEVDAIFAAATLRTCAAGDAILTEGEPGDSMFFLVEGSAEARLESGKTVRSYKPGSYFGELSWINPGHRRSATIVASTPIRLQELDQSSIETLLRGHPNVLFTLMRRTCAFLVDAERNLISDLRRRNTELQETIKKLDFTRNRLSAEEEAARRDVLTGLYNRRCFDDELPVFIERSQAISCGLAVFAMDLDHFKPVNDTHGHAAGDAVLRAFAGRLRELVRPSDAIARVGGDEFAIALAGVRDRARADTIAEAIVAAANLPFQVGALDVTIGASVGIALQLEPGADWQALVAHADAMLYKAKERGRGTFA